jgi:deoxyribonuclease-4
MSQTNGRRIGPHLPLGQGLLKAADRALEIGATTVQVFTDNPTAWRRRSQPPKALAEFRARLQAAGIRDIAVHAPYLINLCGGNEDFWEKSIQTVARELVVGSHYGARVVVMHIGSHRGLGRDEGIKRLVEGLRRSFALADEIALSDETASETTHRRHKLPMLALENAPGTGDGIGAPIEDLADIIGASAQAGLSMDRIGICLDTAHLWGAGYDISNEDGVDDLAKRLDEILGHERVVALHLNDSRTTVGSRLDRHEHIGAGQMGERGMSEVLNHPWFGSLPTYLETPGMDSGYDKVNLDRARMVIAGEELPPLPPEAFTLRGSRARTAPPDR